MARVIPFSYVVELGEIIPLTLLDTVDNSVNTVPMSCESKSMKSGCKSPQCLVDQRPVRENQVIGRKSKIIRRDKRKKVKYL